MSKDTRQMPGRWMALGTVALVAVSVLAAGCSKKEEQASEQPATETPEVAQPASMVAGTYTTEMPAAGAPGRKITLTLNADNTASISTDNMSGEPPVVENGTWRETGAGGTVDVMILHQAGETMTMSFTISGDTLRAVNPDVAMWGPQGLTLMKSSTGY